MENLSHEYELDLHENEPVGRSHCYMTDFGLVLTQAKGNSEMTYCFVYKP